MGLNGGDAPRPEVDCGGACAGGGTEDSPERPRTVLTRDTIATTEHYRRLSAAARAKLQAFANSSDPRLLKWINDYFLVATAFLAGLTISEVSALDWRDVDLDARLLHVRSGRGGRPRSVRLVRELAGNLEELAELQSRYMATWFQDAEPSLRPVFVSPKTRRRLCRRGIHGRWTRLAALADLPPGVTFKSLRHGYAVSSLRSGVTVEMLQLELGHTNREFTTVYESFAADSDLDDAAGATRQAS